MIRLILLVFVAIALPGRANACTLFDWNPYDGFYEPNIIRLAREATTIDWVDIRVTGPQRCPRFPDPMFERDAYLAAMAAELEPINSSIDICDFSLFPQPGMFAADVVERLKGNSLSTFELYEGAADGTDKRFGFADIRELPIGAAYSFNRDQRIEADERHASLAYWYRAVADMPLDGTDSCGGRPAFSPNLRYIVFRDARGAVTGYVPVRHQDDVLLTRLRQLRDDPRADMRTAMHVEEYFRRAIDLALARVGRCGTDATRNDGGASAFTPNGIVTIERGDATFLTERYPLKKNEAAFSYLADHFSFRGETCPESGLVLIADLDMTDASGVHSGWNLRDHIMKVAALLLDPEYGADYVRDWQPWMLEQPIRVAEGNRVRLSDIQSGLRLEGPESVSVDDVLRWHEEGKATRPRR
jgi:hypothetical protein